MHCTHLRIQSTHEPMLDELDGFMFSLLGSWVMVLVFFTRFQALDVRNQNTRWCYTPNLSCKNQIFLPPRRGGLWNSAPRFYFILFAEPIDLSCTFGCEMLCPLCFCCLYVSIHVLSLNVPIFCLVFFSWTLFDLCSGRSIYPWF